MALTEQEMQELARKLREKEKEKQKSMDCGIWFIILMILFALIISPMCSRLFS